MPRLACIACATEMSQINDNSIDTLDEHLYTHGMKRVDAPPDGHCIIHSCRMGLAEVGTKMEHEDLLQLAVTEISDNLRFYSEFLPDEDLSSQLEAYALLHNYQSTVVDLMVYALTNATNTTCNSVQYTRRRGSDNKDRTPTRE